MKTTKFDFSRRLTKKNMEVFADLCLGISERIGFKVSSRGWCYLMEQAGYINKNEFDKVEKYYKPDLLVERKQGLFIEEIKPLKLINLPINIAKFEHAIKYANNYGYKFKIVTEKEIFN